MVNLFNEIEEKCKHSNLKEYSFKTQLDVCLDCHAILNFIDDEIQILGYEKKEGSK